MHPGQVHKDKVQVCAGVCRDLQWNRILHPLQVLVHTHCGLHRVHFWTGNTDFVSDRVLLASLPVHRWKVVNGIFIQEATHVRQPDNRVRPEWTSLCTDLLCIGFSVGLLEPAGFQRLGHPDHHSKFLSVLGALCESVDHSADPGNNLASRGSGRHPKPHILQAWVQ